MGFFRSTADHTQFLLYALIATPHWAIPGEPTRETTDKAQACMGLTVWWEFQLGTATVHLTDSYPPAYQHQSSQDILEPHNRWENMAKTQEVIRG